MRKKMVDWTKFEKKALRDWLVDILHTNEVNLTFTKKDGSERVMLATLDELKVSRYEKKTERTKEINEEIIPVFDLEKKEWRSFRLDALKHIQLSTNK